MNHKTDAEFITAYRPTTSIKYSPQLISFINWIVNDLNYCIFILFNSRCHWVLISRSLNVGFTASFAVPCNYFCYLFTCLFHFHVSLCDGANWLRRAGNELNILYSMYGVLLDIIVFCLFLFLLNTF